jgi:hypothetical protein
MKEVEEVFSTEYEKNIKAIKGRDPNKNASNVSKNLSLNLFIIKSIPAADPPSAIQKNHFSAKSLEATSPKLKPIKMENADWKIISDE